MLFFFLASYTILAPAFKVFDPKIYFSLSPTIYPSFNFSTEEDIAPPYT